MKYEHLAIATAYADAKGLPYETKTKEKIISLGGVVAAFIEPDTYSPDFPDFQQMPVGTFSDDTQHTLAVMESMSAVGHFDLRDLALRLKLEMAESDAGWGGATKSSIEKVHSEITLDELARLGARDSNGCGPLMRLAPIAIYEAVRGIRPQMIGETPTELSTTLTHNSPKSSVSALVHSTVLQDLIYFSDGEKTSVAAWHAAKKYEKWFNEDTTISSKIARSLNARDFAEEIYDDKKEAFAAWSVQALCYAVYDTMRGAPFKELIDAVIAEGGDTDSTAALVAGMWVCEHPDEDPGVDITQLQQSERLVTAGNAFAQLIASQSS